LADEKPMHAFGGRTSFGHGPHQLPDGLDRRASGEHVPNGGLAGVRVGPQRVSCQRHTQALTVYGGHFSNSQQYGIEPARKPIQPHLIAELYPELKINAGLGQA
jgi:hypothetical protein